MSSVLVQSCLEDTGVSLSLAVKDSHTDIADIMTHCGHYRHWFPLHLLLLSRVPLTESTISAQALDSSIDTLKTRVSKFTAVACIGKSPHTNQCSHNFSDDLFKVYSCLLLFIYMGFLFCLHLVRTVGGQTENHGREGIWTRKGSQARPHL